MTWKTFLEEIKYKYSPSIPSVDPSDKESRQNWILFMAQKTKRFPVRQVYDRLLPHLTKATINEDFRFLEGRGLIKRTKDSKNFSYVIPLFEDSGEAPKSPYELKKKLILDIGLPVLAVVLFLVLLAVS